MSHSFEELLIIPRKTTQIPVAAYEPPQKPIVEEVPSKLPQPITEPQPEFKYCSNCGHKIEVHGRFCSNCGANQ